MDLSSEVPQLSPDAVIAIFLRERVPIFQELSNLRHEGWANAEGDRFFQKQRQNADGANDRTADYFFQMMQKVAQEMQRATKALKIRDDNDASILDLCTAPGGFLKIVQDLNPSAYTKAFSLSEAEGGHKVLLPPGGNLEVELLDITLLVEDMDGPTVPAGHADADKFLSRRLPASQRFNIVLCDGQVLRTHQRASYRESCEARRLITTQMVLGLDHVKVGGTMVILLHKVESWNTVCLLWRFAQFATVRLFKPARAHAKRSSFYLVATDIRADHRAARECRRLAQASWSRATFGASHTDDPCTADLAVNDLLRAFGAELIRLAEPVWRTQARALATAPFITRAAAI